MSVAATFVPTGVDTNRANVARVYDAMLGGKDNYAVDREVTRELLAVAPELATIAHDNRQWLTRVTRFLVAIARVEQILDCGCGLPGIENVHELTARLNPDAKVIYIDNDPVVAAHARALLTGDEHAFFAQADLTRPKDLLTHDTVTTHLDPAQPTALLQAATLHHIPDQLDPAAIMRDYIDLLPSGSYVAITHFHNPNDNSLLSELTHRLQDTMVNSSMGSGFFRTRDQITDMFADLDLLTPGLAPLPSWWPDGPSTKPLLPVQQLILGGVARKR